MTTNEANRVIAEFMGCVLKEQGWYVPEENGVIHELNYSRSIDSLVPVWEKLGKHLFLEFCRHDVNDYHWATFFDHKLNIDEGTVDRTIQEAACIATARAIKELGNEY